MKDFAVAAVCPITAAHAGLAVATARAGGIALLDAEPLAWAASAPGAPGGTGATRATGANGGDRGTHVEAAEVASRERALALLRILVGSSPPAPPAPQGAARFGLRLRSAQIPFLAPLLDELAAHDHWLLLCDPDTVTAASLGALPASSRRQIWIEISTAEQVARRDLDDMQVAGWVARGQECGGFVGPDSAFILAQKLAAAGLRQPFLVRGGIGVHNAAACKVAGAAGVVLDDQLWLMPESPLPERWRPLLETIDGQEAMTLGDELGVPCRVLFRRDLAAASQLRQSAQELFRQPAAPAALIAAGDARPVASDVDSDVAERARRAEQWRQVATARLGWGSPEEHAWPMGQAVGLADMYRKRYHTTGRLIRALRAAVPRDLAAALDLEPLAAGSPLARSHGTRYPLVQGPMTRVSDSAAFAAAVADAGGLPLVALALMRQDAALALLQDTRQQLAGRPWGVGILGFVPPERRAEQLVAIAEAQPPFALIAGGRPDQAAVLESRGVATYLHVPAPSLLRQFLEQGARRFVFEGRECGGHIGPLSSFVLWEIMVETLLDATPARELEKLHVLFAGGIHDALSAAMVSAIAAPLAARGVRVGALLGTAYLFTTEAVTSGAISESFQRQALACADTVELKTGLGHIIRCAPTPFAAEFRRERERLIRDGAAAETVRDALDALGLGRARIAAKGMARNAAGGLEAVDRGRQERDGMFMMGRLATLRTSISTMAQVHAEVSEASRAHLAAALAAPRDRGAEQDGAADPASPANIAVVGIGCLVPGARELETFWRNVLRKTETITEIPLHRWDWRVLYSTDPKEADKTVSKWGGFFAEVPFDPLRYGIPPNSMRSLSTSQLLALEVARWALADAGYENGDFDRENTAVIIGTGANGDLEQHFLIRSALPFITENPESDVWKRLPEWTEESFAGVLANVTAGRVANRFDLGGANYTVDSACASSLTVIDLAISELRTGRSSMVVATGLDFEQTPYFYQGFSRVQALSPTGVVRSFDEQADGIVISEGAVVVLLKRLADAERDGDKIYAVIQSAAGSSDGKGLGMTAPRSIGQRRALRRAYAEAGCSPASIGLYEAHGTGTPVGDRAELETVVAVLEEAGAAAKSCVVGSAKSLLGHTKAAAGMVGLAKAVLALHHRTLPPHAHVEHPLASLVDPASPVYLLREPRPWLNSGGAPRRAGVSAFGFGGTNFHAVVEEYRGAGERRAPGEDAWPSELVVLRAADRGDLIAELRRVAQALERCGAAAPPRLADVAYTLVLRADERRDLPVLLALVADDVEKLAVALAGALSRLAQVHEEADHPLGPLGHLAWQVPAASGTVAFLFPGQGAQMPDMAREMTVYLPELRAAIEEAERLTDGAFDRSLGELLFPPAAFTEDEAAAQRRRIDDTHVAQPAIGAVSLGLLDFAARLGLTAAMTAGHSYGELTALHAAGVLERADLLRLSEVRGRLMATAPLAGSGESGGMVAVQLGADELAGLLHPGDQVVIANRNAPDQSVLSGTRQALAAIAERLTARGVRVRPLAVSGAFHSPLMAAVEEPLVAAIGALVLRPPRLTVFGNATAAPYPAVVDEVRAQLAGHLRSAVDFVGQIRQMYDQGARVFIELGPGRMLTTLVPRILGEAPHLAVAFDGGGMRGLLQGLGRLLAGGVAVDLQALFDGRPVRRLDLDQIAAPALAPTVWMVDGGRVRRPHEAAGTMGQLPLLNLDSITAARERAAAPPASVAVGAPPATGGENQGMPVRRAEEGGVGMGDAFALEAYRAYQETMRQFLVLQERVMAQVLGQPGASADAQTPLAARPSLAPIAPHASLAALAPLASIAPRLPPSLGTPIAPPAPIVAAPAALPPPLPVEAPLAAAGPQVAAEPPTGAPQETLDRARLSATVLGLVSERTGYPAEMLDFDQDIEADLGIDSIKRIEILDAFRRTLPEPVRSAAEHSVEALVRAKSLGRWVDTVMDLAAVAAAPAAAALAAGTVAAPVAAPRMAETAAGPIAGSLAAGPEPGSPAARPVAGEASAVLTGEERDCPRWVMRGRPVELDEHDAIRPAGLFLITADELGVAARVAASLRRRGAMVEVVERAVLAAPGESGRLARVLVDRHGAIQGLVHLAPLARAGADDLAAWRQATQIEVKSLFEILRVAASGFENEAVARQACLVGATLLGGTWGRGGEPAVGSAAGGGVYGLLKTLTSEYGHIHARAVDLDAHLDSERMAEIVTRELLCRGTGTDFEVGYPGGRRTVFNPVPAPFASSQIASQPAAPAEAWLPEAGWVVLLTGGARGITAELGRRLAAPGVRMVLVGRSPLPLAEEAELVGLDGATEVRRLLLARSRGAGEAATPAQIEERVRGVLRGRELRRNLDALRQRGAEVEYVAADAAGADDLPRIVADLYERYGRLDAVVHGAGVIEDRWLRDKTRESFERVFDTKADSTFLLRSALRARSVRWVVLMSSISGRIGNRGQIDYAAANEVMNRLAWRMADELPATRISSINWGPWSGAGMAGEAVVRELEARGLRAIDLETGWGFLRHELSAAGPAAVEVIAGETPEMTLQAAPPSADASAPAAGASRVPLPHGELVGAGAEVNRRA